MAGDPVDSLLMSLVEKEIPEGRNALLESHKNLADLSEYCKVNYINSTDKTKALQETKEYASQSLASVAYQIHSLAVNILQMMDQQTIQLQKMQSNANNTGLLVDIHKEKVARREIGALTSSKNFSRSHKVVPPAQPEKVKKYKREEIDYTSLDGIGHGVKGERKEDVPSERRSSKSSSSGSLKENSTSSVHSSSQGSIPILSGSIYASNSSDRKGAFGSTLPSPHRPPVAPVAPFKVKAGPIPTAAPVAPTQHVDLALPSTPELDERGGFDDLSDIPPPPPQTPASNDAMNLPPPPPPPPPAPVAEDLYATPPSNMRAVDVDDIPPMPPVLDDLPPPPPEDNAYDDGGVPDDQSLYDYPAPAPMPPPPPMDFSPPQMIPEKYEEKVIAIYDYQKLRDDELELMEGDIIYVIKKNEDGWFEGIKDGIQGLFPGNYVTPYM